MRTGNKGQNLIKSSEELRLKAYMPTPNDVPTIGWGTTLNVKMGDEIDFKTAQSWFERDLEKFEDCVNDAIEVDITQEQFDACISLCYNIGCNAFSKSTLVRLVNEDAKPDIAALQFLRWDKQAGLALKGLTIRRKREMELFLS